MWRHSIQALLALPAMAAAGGKIDFNRDIRPILSENCFYCHGQDANHRQAGLRLDDRAVALKRGAVEPGDPQASLMIGRIHATDADVVMPPPDSNRRLSAGQKRLLRQWIAEGAEYAPHWAFAPPRRPAVPSVPNQGWAHNPIDRFVLNKLNDNGLSPSPQADRATLIKRLHADFIGLPPTPAEVDAFVNDPDPHAYEKLVDRLLANPHYGERLALPWLDAARYADSNGFQQDGDTWQWIWRDWVIRALNADMPFDDFTTWQLAGDLLPEPTTDQLIASGFNRNHLQNGEGGAIPEEQRFVNLFDRVDTTSTTWLGLTVACAQCHDHKYDPITQRDYYSLLDAFNRVPEAGRPQRQSVRFRVAKPFIELPTPENRRRIAEFDKKIAAAEKTARPVTEAAFAGWRLGVADKKKATRQHFDREVRAKLAKDVPAIGRVEKLKKRLAAYRGDRIPRVMVMSDAKPRQSHILERGQYLSKGEPVSFATPAFLPPLPEDAPRDRLGLARWLLSPEHPLTARVQVNRMWQYFFGVGLVKTAEDLGVQSEYPPHKDLLDWLAVEFSEGGWGVKRMHRLIATSATYRQASRVTSPARDPENRLLSRMTRRRMPAMVLRDWAMAASGLLNRRVGGAPVYPYLPPRPWEALAITKERDFTYPESSGAALYRRSVYTFWRRTVGPANMFDASSRQACRVRTATTSTPLHALTTLNDPTWVEAARALAERAMHQRDTTDGRLRLIFRRVACRDLPAGDLSRLRRAYAKQVAIYRRDAAAAVALLAVGDSPSDDSLPPAEHAALTAVALAVLNLDESLTRE